MTSERLAEIKARAEAATSGPWESGFLHGMNVVSARSELIATLGFENGDDSDFIAHARQDVPDLLAEVERLREALRQIADSTKWGEDTAIKREITRIQSDAAHALRVKEVT